MKKFVTLLLSFCLFVFSAFGMGACIASGPIVSDSDNSDSDVGSLNAAAYEKLDRSGLFGIDEPILECTNYTFNPNTQEYTHSVENFNLEATAYLAGALGAKSHRFRIPRVFASLGNTYDETMYNYLKRAASLMIENGVTHLIGMLEIFPTNTGFVPETNKSVPGLDDPYYDDWMNAVYEQTKMVVKLFPEIKMWEMGNEMNSAVFFHPNGYQAVTGSLEAGLGAFEWEEHVQVYTDYMYYMAKGIHEVAPDAIAFTGGYAFTGGIGSYETIEWFVGDTYELIKSGKAPSNVPESERSTNVRDYFDGLSWHPYATNKEIGVSEAWLQGNNQIYSAAIKNGDEGIPVIFTEFGFSGTDENTELMDKQIGWMAQAFEYMKNDMPYVVACCAFRLYQCQSAVAWGGTHQNYWGYFTENLDGTGNYPRKKALELQKLYGGTGDLYKYALCAVRFDSDGGSKVPSQIIGYNGKITEPTAPKKSATATSEYVFDGWYFGDEKWDFANNTVTVHITLKAKWKVQSNYTVEFLPSDI